MAEISEMRRERRRLFLVGGNLLPESSPDARLTFLCPVDDVDVTDEGVADLLKSDYNWDARHNGSYYTSYLDESCPRVLPRLAGAAFPLGTEALVRIVPCPCTDLLLLRLGVHVRFSAIRVRLIHSSYRVFQPV